MQKLYCYVDESGQDTIGSFFVVSVVVLENTPDMTTNLLKRIEYQSGKRGRKWKKSKAGERQAYIQHVIRGKHFQGALRFATFRDTTAYDTATVTAIAHALDRQQGDYRATILVDALSKKKQGEYANQLRKGHRIPVHKVGSIRKDEHNVTMLLADAVAGLVRKAVLDEVQDFQTLLGRGIRNGTVIDVSE